jgi:diguanylate cyclase (GGDEF)-like protein
MLALVGVGALCPVALAASPPQTPAQPAATPVSAQATADALKTALDLAQKAHALLALDAWGTAGAPPLEDALNQLSFSTATDRPHLLALLEQADANTATDATKLQTDGVVASQDVVLATTPLDLADLNALDAGQTISLGWQHVLAALDDLVNRGGQAAAVSTAARTPPDPPEIADALSNAAGTTPAAAPAPTTTTSKTTTSGSDDVLLILIGALVFLLLGGGFFVLRRVARPEPRGGSAASSDRPVASLDFEVLLDVSRRLAGLADAPEIHRALLREAIGLVGARTGAVILREGDDLVVSCEGEGSLLVREHLVDGAIGRVAETGQPVVQVSANEPSIRNLPVALVGVPLIVGGSVYAVLVLVRSASAPFTGAERDLLSALAPVAASAMLTAEQATTAVEQSLVDPLTGIGNRRRFDLDLEHAFADPDGRPLALIMVDLDHFKSINDTHGHPAGDAVLKGAARRVQETLRAGEAVYRYGGEEFAVILPATSREDALTAAERIRRTLAEEPLALGHEGSLAVTASLGVSAPPADATLTAAELIAVADEALYRAKTSGRNRVCGGELAAAV